MNTSKQTLLFTKKLKIMKKYIITSIIYYFSFFIMVSAQEYSLIIDTVCRKDTVIIKLNGYIGEIQWQRSYDSLNWVYIAGENEDSIILNTERNIYIRAEVKVGVCTPFYSDIAYIKDPINYKILYDVCMGIPTDSFANPKKNKLNKIIILDSKGDRHVWNDQVSPLNQPSKMNEVELIAHVNSEWYTIETCTYCDGVICIYHVYRKANRVTILVYAASTGALLDSTIFYGSSPRDSSSN